MRDWLQRLFCRHVPQHFMANVSADGAQGTFTIAGWQCHKCGAWKLTLFYHS